MTHTVKHSEAIVTTVVELTHGVLARTTIPSAHHSALRSGFAGHPANPRWNAAKVIAWKTGRQWRTALAQGEMVVRSTDSMLIPHVPLEHSPSITPPKLLPRLEGPFCLLRDALFRRPREFTQG
jgi:hypothetical protein